jgi:N-acetyl-anhydromuramyl-L-alanine amidase AmpD
MHRMVIVFSLFLLANPVLHAQTADDYLPLFNAAAREWNVPSPILQAVAYVETRWTPIVPDVTRRDDERHMPPAYGMMALRDDAWFGHSLVNGAALIHEDVAAVQGVPATNIRAAAALLASLFRAGSPGADPAALLNWSSALAAYSGIPQRDLQEEYVREIYQVLQQGVGTGDVHIDPQPIGGADVTSALTREFGLHKTATVMSDDYPAAVWSPSQNYSSRAGSAITHIIIHDTEGSFAGSVSWLQDPVAQASAHYIIRSSDGYIVQLVREADKAWHVVCWNAWTLGVEHEGYVAQPAYFTLVMYQASAKLVRHFCNTYGINADRLHIVGHNVWQDPVIFPQLGWENCNTHTDPGQYWNWPYYFSLVAPDSVPPVLVSHYPADQALNIPVYKSITLSFDRPMDVTLTSTATTVTPAVPASIQWSADARTLTLVPTGKMANNTWYKVEVGAGAKSVGGAALRLPAAFWFLTGDVDTTGPAMVRSYPVAAGNNVGVWAGFQVFFDEPVVYGSFASRVKLVDLADSTVNIAVAGVSYADLTNGSVVMFNPAAGLKYNHSYRLSFMPGLKDPLGNLSSREQRIPFTTTSAVDPSGTVTEPFETNAPQWQQPWGGSGSAKLDSGLTSFGISTTRKKTGSYSGNLGYGFTDSLGGVCRLEALTPPSISPSATWAGLWVWGDNSVNQIDVEFSGSGGRVVAIRDTLDWFGWKLLSAPAGSGAGSPAGLATIVVRQLRGGAASGAIYLDDWQQAVPTGVETAPAGLAGTFSLLQNYPNPFNPTTSIMFVLERPDHVRLMVYNALGQGVARLIDAPMEAGRFRFEFQGRSDAGASLPSGVYFYRLQTGAGSLQRSMVLLK